MACGSFCPTWTGNWHCGNAVINPGSIPRLEFIGCDGFFDQPSMANRRVGMETIFRAGCVKSRRCNGSENDGIGRRKFGEKFGQINHWRNHGSDPHHGAQPVICSCNGTSVCTNGVCIFNSHDDFWLWVDGKYDRKQNVRTNG